MRSRHVGLILVASAVLAPPAPAAERLHLRFGVAAFGAVDPCAT